MYNDIWESGFKWLILMLVGCMDKVSEMSLFAFSPQFTTFLTYFPVSAVVYKTCLYISLALGITIFLFKVTEGIFFPDSKHYESPFGLIRRFALFIILLFMLPFLMLGGTKMAGTIYWDTAVEIENFENNMALIDYDYDEHYGYDSEDSDEVIIKDNLQGMWSTLMKSLSVVIEEGENDDEAEIVQEKDSWGGTLTKIFLGGTKFVEAGLKTVQKVTGVGGFISSFILPDEINPLKGLSKLIGEGINSIDTYVQENIDPSWQVNKIDSGIVTYVLSGFLTIYVFWNYLMYLIEMGERYIVFTMLTFLAPLALAPTVSQSTSDISKRFLRMYVSQLAVLCFSALFLCIFRVSLYSGVSAIAGTFTIDPGHGIYRKTIGGAYIYMLMLGAFLKMGQRIDSYLNSLGLSTAQTGIMLGQSVMSLARSVTSTGQRVASGVLGASQKAASLQEARIRPGADGLTPDIRNSLGQAAKDTAPGKKLDGGIDFTKTSPDVAKSALADTREKGYAGFEGEAGKTYAETLFQGDGRLIPKDAQIMDAAINTDGGGTVRYMDKDGELHDMTILSDTPEEGAYKPTTDATGAEYYAQENVPGAFDAEGVKMTPPEGMPLDDIESTSLKGTSETDMKEAFGFDKDEGSYMVDFGKDGISVFDGNGNEVASGIRRTDDAGNVEDAYKSLSADGNNKPAVIKNNDGSFTYGQLKQPDDMHPNLKNYDERFMSLDNGRVNLAGTINGKRITDMNSSEAEKASWMVSEMKLSKPQKMTVKDAGCQIDTREHSAPDADGYMHFNNGDRMRGTYQDGSYVGPEDFRTGKASHAAFTYEKAERTKGREVSFAEAKALHDSASTSEIKGSAMKLSSGKEPQRSYEYADAHGTRTYTRAEAEGKMRSERSERTFDGGHFQKLDTAPRKENAAYTSKNTAELTDSLRSSVERRISDGYTFAGKSLDTAAKLELGETIPYGREGKPHSYVVLGGRGFKSDGSQEYIMKISTGNEGEGYIRKMNFTEVPGSQYDTLKNDPSIVKGKNGKLYYMTETKATEPSEKNSAKEDMDRRAKRVSRAADPKESRLERFLRNTGKNNRKKR